MTEKQDIKITNVEGSYYKAIDGKRTVYFNVGDKFTVTIVKASDKDGKFVNYGKKPLVFYGSKPAVMLAMGRMLKHIAGFVLALRKEGIDV
jgi:hypothetical protein